MAWVAAAVGAAGLITAGIKSHKEGQNKKKIAREIANQKRPELANAADGLQVSTLGSDLQKEEQARLAATQTASLQDSGSRAIIGGIGQVAASSQGVNNRIAADLDQQQKNINMMKADDTVAIRGIKEQRSQGDMAALSSQYNAASQSQDQAMANGFQAAGMAANAYSSKTKTATGASGKKSGEIGGFNAGTTKTPDSIGWKSKIG